MLIQSKIIYWILQLLPKELLTLTVGKLAHYVLPRWLTPIVLNIFSYVYKVNKKEMAAPISSYKTFHEFFTRPLKAGTRSIDYSDDIIVSPVDGTIVSFGKVINGQALQIKNMYYQMKDIIHEHSLHKRFEDGTFLTIYLSPGEYHRIHMPYSGKAFAVEHHRGSLYPVNIQALQLIQGLFTLNERLCTFIEASFGVYAIVKVAALNVGNIKTVFPQTWARPQKAGNSVFHKIQPPINLEKGQELGHFELGSTIVLFFEKENISLLDNLHEGMHLQYGKKLAHISKN